jgi:hypothetical protein
MLRQWMLTAAVMGLAAGMALAGDDDLPPPQTLPPAAPAPTQVLPAPRVAVSAAPVAPVRPIGPMVVVPSPYQPLPPGVVIPPIYPLRRRVIAPYPYPYPPPPVTYRVSAYQVWQNYSVNMFGEWRPRVISTSAGSYYNGNGHYYPWARTRMGEVMPWGPSSAP